jgi:hypothetical protein
MTQRTRYLLILAGFVFFLMAAPLMVLYVRGITYDFATKTFVKTGIMGVRTSPSDATVFINGKVKRQSQGDIGFLVPGAYQVEIKKTGYSDWSKRLNVDAGQVTWANPSFGSIYLFLKNPPAQNLAQGVLDFYSQNGNLVYLTPQSAVVAASDNLSSRQVYPLPKNVTEILTEDASGQNFILSNNSAATSTPEFLVFNKTSGTFIDISSLFPNAVNPVREPSAVNSNHLQNNLQSMPASSAASSNGVKFQFGSNGELYALSDNFLYSVDLENKIKTAIFNGVRSFYFQGGELYYIQQTGQSYGLFDSQAPFSQNQLLVAGLPDFDSGDLFVTLEKEVFLLADNKLYLVSSNMRQISDNISIFNFDPNSSLISLIQSGEFDYYDPVGMNLNFVTRSSETLANPRVLTGIGNAFFLQDEKLMVIELDARDNQNQYQLYQGANVKKFFVDGAGKNVLLLDNGELKSLVVR